MARRIVVEFLGKDTSAGKTAQEVEKRFGKLGSKLDKVGQAAGKALTGGLAIAGVAAYKAGQKASDLAETQSKVAQIFGEDSVDALDKFAGTADKQMGQSKQTALDAAATFGMFGKSAGLAGDDLVGFSTDLTGLASDMASFNNTSPEQAIEAIGAALRGESEPIRAFGVMLDDATLKEEAMRLGLIKTTKEALTPQQKVLAAQAAIYKQTKDQQGDFAKTSDGLANKQRIMTAQFENLSAELGAKVLPAMLKLTDVGLKMIRWVDENRTVVGALVVGLGGMAAAVWTVSAAMRAWIVVTKVWKAITIVARNVQLAFNLALMANPIGLVIAAIAALAIGLVVAYKKSETFRKIVNKAFGAVKDVVVGAWNKIKAAAVAVWDWLSRTWPKVQGVVTAPIRLAVGIVKGYWTTMRNGVAGVRDFITSAIASIPGKLRALGGRFLEAGRAVINAFIDGLKNAGGVISGIANNVWSTLKGLLNGAIDKINAALEFTISLPGPDIHINPPNIPYLAKGTNFHRGGLAVVGEEGPELVNLPRGSQVIPNGRSMGTPRGLGGAGIVVNINGPVYGDPQAFARHTLTELRKLKRVTGTDLGLA